MKQRLKDTLVLLIAFTLALLVALYFYFDIVVDNPFTPVVLIVFYGSVLISHFTMK